MKHANLFAIPALSLLTARAYLRRSGNPTSYLNLRILVWTIAMIVPLISSWTMRELLVDKANAVVQRQRDGAAALTARLLLTTLFVLILCAFAGSALSLMLLSGEWQIAIAISEIVFAALVAMTVLSAAGTYLILKSGRGRKGSQADLRTLRRQQGEGWTLMGLAASPKSSTVACCSPVRQLSHFPAAHASTE
jgi:hypothetical protein